MERTTVSKITVRTVNVPTTKPKSASQSATADMPSIRVLGRLCPRCGVAGAVLCESKHRIIYECPNGHVFETQRRPDDSA
jgi:ribosomal protein S27AE